MIKIQSTSATLAAITILLTWSLFAQANEVTVAQVNDQAITLKQVNEQYSDLSRSGLGSMSNKTSALEMIIKRELGAQEAKRLKLDQDPSVIQQINMVLFNAAMDKRINAELDQVTLSDNEARKWYQSNPEIRTSHIFYSLSGNASKEEENKAIDKLKLVLKDIRSGKMSFAEAAQRNSEDAAAANGGDMGYRLKDRLDPVYYNAAIKLSPGQIAGPIRSPYGVHLVRLVAKHSWLETDRIQVKRLIVEERRQAVADRYLAELRKKAKVSINSDTIKD
jgi:peptidyl-prolyl cis-trans isomerase C